jgi:Methane oxygenase PmoA
MKSLLHVSILIACITIISFSSLAQQVKVMPVKNQQQVLITINNKPFTSFNYPDSLAKPFLYPIYAPDGEIVTRGFPLVSRANEPVDHPHHIGLWLNYENVNGLDFWNNSYAIPPDKKSHYGSINNTKVVATKSGKEGNLTYTADWQDINNKTLLRESSTFIFNVVGNAYIIDRITILTAATDVTMPDIKDGFLGLRVAHELEIPSKEDKEFTDANGIITVVKAADDKLPSGNYITSEGKEGDAAWGTRAKWCMLYGKKGNDTISIVIMDHAKNIGYPTYWHARGYGLFAANPLGQKIFSNGKETLNFGLKKDESVRFRYRLVINAAKERLTNDEINKVAKAFEALY